VSEDTLRENEMLYETKPEHNLDVMSMCNAIMLLSSSLDRIILNLSSSSHLPPWFGNHVMEVTTTISHSSVFFGKTKRGIMEMKSIIIIKSASLRPLLPSVSPCVLNYLLSFL